VLSRLLLPCNRAENHFRQYRRCAENSVNDEDAPLWRVVSDYERKEAKISSAMWQVPSDASTEVVRPHLWTTLFCICYADLNADLNRGTTDNRCLKCNANALKLWITKNSRKLLSMPVSYKCIIIDIIIF
jgi:hypothetical protein